MRGLINYIRNTWQPSAVVLGTIVAICGASATTLNLTAWLAPVLGPWPAATVGGVLTAAAALRWARYAVVKESDPA